MNRIDSVLRFICCLLSYIFGLLVVSSISRSWLCIWDDTIACLAQIRALGLVAGVSFIVGMSFNVIADGITK